MSSLVNDESFGKTLSSCTGGVSRASEYCWGDHEILNGRIDFLRTTNSGNDYVGPENAGPNFAVVYISPDSGEQLTLVLVLLLSRSPSLDPTTRCRLPSAVPIAVMHVPPPVPSRLLACDSRAYKRAIPTTLPSWTTARCAVCSPLKEASVPSGFLSYKYMEERVKDLDETENRDLDGLAGPRRPLEDPEGGVNEVEEGERYMHSCPVVFRLCFMCLRQLG